MREAKKSRDSLHQILRDHRDSTLRENLFVG
jgi:hypothetical protein